MRRFVLAFCVLLAPIAAAQELRVALGSSGGSIGGSPATGVAGGTEVALGIAGLTVDLAGGIDVGARLAARGGAAPRVGADLRLRANLPLGPLGGVAFRAAGLATSGGALRGALAVDGAYGPVALRLAADLATTDRDDLDPVPAAEADLARPRLGQGPLRFGAEAEGQLRLSRVWIVGVTPRASAVRGAAGWSWGGRLAGEVRRRGAVDRDDLSLLVDLAAPPAPGTTRHAALGVRYTRNVRRAPPWSASAWLGVGRTVAPGVRLEGRWRDGTDTIELALAAEPWRGDAPPYRLGVVASRRGDPPLAGRWTLGARLEVTAAGAARGRVALAFDTPLSAR